MNNPLTIRLKKNKCYVSKLMTDWKTWPECVFFNRLFFFFFFWAVDVSDLSRSQLWNMELDFGWTRYKTEDRVEEVCCSKCFVSVVSFLVYFDKQVHKKLEKKLSKQKKIQTLNFAESNAHRKTNARGSFET